MKLLRFLRFSIESRSITDDDVIIYISFLYLATNSRYDTPFVVLILANQENTLFFFSLPICDYKVLPNVFRISTVSVQFTFRDTHSQSVSKVTQFPAKTGIQQVDSILFWSCLCILS